MPSGYRKGANFERRVRDYLEQMGADTTRSAGSHTVKDIVAVFPGPIVWYVQCRTTKRLKPEEREILLELEKTLSIIPKFAYKEKGKIIIEGVFAKEPTFHYEVIGGRFVKVNE